MAATSDATMVARPLRSNGHYVHGSNRSFKNCPRNKGNAVAKAMAQKALAPNPNPQWTEYEMRSIDEWISRQDVKLDRPEAIRRLVELGLKAKREKT
jgi:hypothetical protein